MFQYVVATLLAAVSARPEAGFSGGSYSAPPPSGGGTYGPPAPQYGPPAAAPVVHKHVYVHVPPPENEYPAARKPIAVAPPQKHYKIVFIKAPTAPTPTAPEIPLQPQDEQKTLIYVLVKKPEEAPEITIPTPAPTQPSKPEVYFIRYKTQVRQVLIYYIRVVAPFRELLSYERTLKNYVIFFLFKQKIRP